MRDDPDGLLSRTSPAGAPSARPARRDMRDDHDGRLSRISPAGAPIARRQTRANALTGASGGSCGLRV